MWHAENWEGFRRITANTSDINKRKRKGKGHSSSSDSINERITKPRAICIPSIGFSVSLS